eukprot:CAMPEP_0201118866 /NCGR_PEP_ID=MMETSP0850-20130426/3062_1 /ASSEMBLY_ACC=CAM_ASM_000622 /TAXON_ID=183588 /ORGANISM="Pseudo-nitzschia fraudulenta, Strain WWA7" /LENGTH=1146 /DNA_ID=CAMNT_0047384333 /DNA_START=208 /DNA_END=3648 /DNA_ORIENTATION=+
MAQPEQSSGDAEEKALTNESSSGVSSEKSEEDKAGDTNNKDNDTDLEKSSNKGSDGILETTDDTKPKPKPPETETGDADHLNGFLQREARRMSRNPCTYMWTSIVVFLVLSWVGITVGEFVIEVENYGWWSRGLPLSERNRQALIINHERFNLAYNASAWDILTDVDLEHPGYEYLLNTPPTIPAAMENGDGVVSNFTTEIPWERMLRQRQSRIEDKVRSYEERRRTEEDAPANILAGCNLGFYGNPSGNSLWPVWRMPDKEYESTETRSVLDADVLEAICVAEQNTQAYLEENGLCRSGTSKGCATDKCLQPYSIVLYARLIVEGGLDANSDGGPAMDCQALSKAWSGEIQDYVRDNWMEDVKDLKIKLTPGSGASSETPPAYPYGYYPALVQTDFDTNGGRSQYTSSIFDTAKAASNTELIDAVENFDRSSENGKDGVVIQGAYDTPWEGMAEIKTDSLVANDMSLACASAIIISVAVILHTQSPLVTALGLLQIVLSFPMGYFTYSLVLGYSYFPFLNFIGVFVVFALGAGDIFVAFDKWTNYRKYNLDKSTEFVAALALPEALSAMFLTTLTTALAFFATAVCPVAPIKMFAIFCGLIIIFDYVLTVAFVFPALCIYDIALIKRANGEKKGCFAGCWMGCIGCGTCAGCCSKTAIYDEVAAAKLENSVEGDIPEKDPLDETSDRYNATQRFMVTLARLLNSARWPLLLICIASFAFCCYYASKLSLPETSEVRLLKPGIQYEQAFMWRKDLLSSDLNNLSGSKKDIFWGVVPSDTGSYTDPYEGSALVLDENFDPSSAEAQVYLRDYCDSLYEEEFARLPEDDYVCPMNQFDSWLAAQSVSDAPGSAYTTLCGGASGLPMDEEVFHGCMTAWALENKNTDVLSRDGVVTILKVSFRNSVLFSDPHDVLQEQLDAIDEYVDAANEAAPEGAKYSFCISTTFHWHETNGSIQKTAYSGAGISLTASAAIILISSHSVVLTVFSTATILFILVSVTSILVAFGWTLGFLESICFSILIGVSVDFVIHFTHAYVHHKGELAREERTKYAMITMGPSILATALTTFFSAVVMLFCTITFFRKFAMVLFLTIVMATFASFVVFITLTNCFGPTNPTYLVDKCLESCGRGKTKNRAHTNESEGAPNTNN